MNTARLFRSLALVAGLVGAGSAAAVDLTVTHFGTGMYGVPFAVARDKGWFKSEAGIDVTGFITSAGGGTTIRNALASEIPYGEVALPANLVAEIVDQRGRGIDQRAQIEVGQLRHQPLGCAGDLRDRGRNRGNHRIARRPGHLDRRRRGGCSRRSGSGPASPTRPRR